MSVEILNHTPGDLTFAVEVARVSSTRENKTASPQKLLRYLIKHGHWSPFEHSYMTVEITTSRAIAAQLLRHRSFTFQELSQRYADITDIVRDPFQPVELRLQHESNRQLSYGRHNDPILHDRVNKHLQDSLSLYHDLLHGGVAKECARMVLPLTTTTHVIMTGSIRSWYHFIKSRSYEGAQKEIRDIASGADKCLKLCFPLMNNVI
ncbi:MAG: FAD-dependent thymidylate synthase [Gammaproteobacteria bacterium]|nr:FAD-dependent thymidylate synthase [Gammaproteobacteria bacterium]